MERNLRTESTSADIFCVILLLRKKAKASFIPHSLEIHRVCFQRLCLKSCGRGVRMRRIGLVNREMEYSDAFRGGKRQEMSFICIPNRNVQASKNTDYPQKRKSTILFGCCVLSRSAQFYPKPRFCSPSPTNKGTRRRPIHFGEEYTRRAANTP